MKLRQHYLFSERPPYWKPPVDACDLCGASLYCRGRWLVKIYVKTPAGPIRLKTLHLCRECLKQVKQALRKNKKVIIKRRKMTTLGYCSNKKTQAPGGSRP